MHWDFLRFGRITALPVIHGSGDFALEVRRVMLHETFDCVAVPLPPSFREHVLNGIDLLPMPSLVSQRYPSFSHPWSLDNDDDPELANSNSLVDYVPIDPCQPVIAALRIARGEHIACEFVDMETDNYFPNTAVLPDPYAVKSVRCDRFAAAILPGIPRPSVPQVAERVVHMADRLRVLEARYRSIAFVCSVLEWPWVREAYSSGLKARQADDLGGDLQLYQVNPETLTFMLGELPFVTCLYERARQELEDDENLSVDGIKELLIAARQAYRDDFRSRARNITPHTLATLLKYIRNLTLIQRRFTPDLYSIVIAAKQVAGDGYALHVAETARRYAFAEDLFLPEVDMSIDRIRLPDGGIFGAVSRLPGHPLLWRSCALKRRPDPKDRARWQMNWNPFGQCSWPPEDDKIENFRSHVFNRARQIMGADLVKTEKFTTSIKDGIDIRDTLRNWHTGDVYVKELPPNRGHLDAAVMLFDSPADPRDYPWRTTWFAEHDNESTLSFFATNFGEEIIGPGIALANYGGALFLFPPIPIPNVWQDARLDFTETLEERLLAAACLHSRAPQIALLSSYPPGPGWRRLARRYKKKWVHVPLGQFSDSTVQQLRMVHVLNGKHVRSYAAHFIRQA
jgi:hypothetical protein